MAYALKWPLRYNGLCPEMASALKWKVFLDSSSLSDLRNLITDGVHKSDTLVLLATKGVLTRPWCLLELLETARKGIPVVLVQVGQVWCEQEV